MNNEDYKNKKRLVIIILIIEIIIIILLLAYCNAQNVDAVPARTAIVEEIDEPLYEPEETGQLAIKVNGNIRIKDGIMRGLNLYNSNKDILMQCKILYNDKEIYLSDKIKAGEMIKDDYIETKDLAYGDNKALLEIYFYDETDKLVGQSNVIINLSIFDNY